MLLKKAAFVLSIFVVASLNAANFSVTNTSDQSINVGVQVPAKTVTLIKLQPIDKLKKLSQQELQDQLFKAIMRDDVEAIKTLVIAGADINYQYKSFKVGTLIATPVLIAKWYNKNLSYKVLLILGAVDSQIKFANETQLKKIPGQDEKESHFKYAMLSALFKIANYPEDLTDNFQKAVKNCLSVGLTMKEIWVHFLHCHFQSSFTLRTSMLKVLLDNYADPNEIAHTTFQTLPIFIMMNSYCNENIELLLDYGADINKLAEPSHLQDTMTPLQWAFMTHNESNVDLLLKRGAKL